MSTLKYDEDSWILIKGGADADTVIQSAQLDFDLKVITIDSLYSNSEDEDIHNIDVYWNSVSEVTVEGPSELSAGQSGIYEASVYSLSRKYVNVSYTWYKRTHGLDLLPFVKIRDTSPTKDNVQSFHFSAFSGV